MPCFVYIVQCSDGSYDTGISWNLRKQLREHNAGIKTPIQKSKLPVKLVYYEKFMTRIEAAQREREIKGWRREKKKYWIANLQNSLH